MQNQGRLQCLKARDEHVKKVLDEARANLSRISADTNRYPPILKGLIMQVRFYIFTVWQICTFTKKILPGPFSIVGKTNCVAMPKTG